MKSEIQLTVPELEYLFTPKAIRERAAQIFERTEKRKSAFRYHADKLEPTVKFVLEVIKQKYPSLDIPFHSRWGHFRAGGVNRVAELDAKISHLDKLERARCKLDLVIPSVLLDAGAGPAWKYREGPGFLYRSEGLGVASFRMFLAGAMSVDRRSPRVDALGLSQLSMTELMDHFQASDRNLLIGLEGRMKLLKNLGQALANTEVFGDGRPGNIIDCLRKRCGESIPAPAILRAVIDGLGPIWPGRLSCRGINLGDIWRHSQLDLNSPPKALVPFHKLSQWLTYSLIEPIQEAGIPVTNVDELTGLAEYRNGGLMLDSGLISLKDQADAMREWKPENDLIIEWRALTIHLLDLIADGVRKELNKTKEEFPLAKVLEGGTWWAGRKLAEEKRQGLPPLNIISDGTVF